MCDWGTVGVAKLLGVSQRKIISMIERGYFKESAMEGSGHSAKRWYSEEDIVRAGNALLLEHIGYTPEKIRQILDEWNSA